jgi:hypothetical protein
VLKWVRQLEGDRAHLPPQKAEAAVVGREEIYQFIQSESRPADVGTLIVAVPVDLQTGTVVGKILLHFDDGF